MVGKANVGKSQLFQTVFPKGRMGWETPKHKISVNVFPKAHQQGTTTDTTDPLLPGRTNAPDDEFSLLPPPRPETNYPAMPVVSSLPGTTASPIRVPFGNGRGELIDLPGLARGDLEQHVREDRRGDLIMKARVVPEQQVIKPGQSLLLGGGLVRITPRNVAPDEELVFLAYAFTPIEPHLTATEKAVALQAETDDAPNIESITVPGTGSKVKHAGAFQLRYDVTKKRTGPLTSKVAVGLKVERLPYRVLGIDILIEGCGWVEVAVQVRTRQLFPSRGSATGVEAHLQHHLQTLDLRPEPVNAVKPKEGRRSSVGEQGEEGEVERDANWPVIDVYTPEGKFIGYRPPMNAWILNKPLKEARAKSRPRKAMKGVKKMEKRMRQAQAAAGSEWGGVLDNERVVVRWDCIIV
jgi:hypothetical protein